MISLEIALDKLPPRVLAPRPTHPCGARAAASIRPARMSAGLRTGSARKTTLPRIFVRQPPMEFKQNSLLEDRITETRRPHIIHRPRFPRGSLGALPCTPATCRCRHAQLVGGRAVLILKGMFYSDLNGPAPEPFTRGSRGQEEGALSPVSGVTTQSPIPRRRSIG